MTQKDPASRLSVSEYLDILQGKLAEAQPSDLPVPPSLPTAAARREGTAAPTVSLNRSSDLATFPAYFDSSLYPLFLKMHWNGITPDDRVNIFCQVR